MVVWIAFAVVTMVCAVTAQHMGLTEAASEVISKVAKCPKCVTLWSTLAVLVWLGSDWFTAATLSVLMSYLSHYYAFVLMMMQRLYNKIWERIYAKSRTA